MATNDNAVKALSDARRPVFDRFVAAPPETIELCQDKYELNVFLRRRNIPPQARLRLNRSKSRKNLRQILERRSAVVSSPSWLEVAGGDPRSHR